MSGRNFYLRQAGQTAAPKPKRKLKADWLSEVTATLGQEVEGLDKCTIPTLTSLLGAINNVKKI